MKVNDTEDENYKEKVVVAEYLLDLLEPTRMQLSLLE